MKKRPRIIVSCFGALLLCHWITLNTSAQLTVVNVSNPGAIQDQFGVQEALTTFQFNAPAGVITDIDIQFAVSHPKTFDLAMHLVSPSGTVVDLFDNVNGAPIDQNGADFRDTRLDDDAGVGPIGTTGFNTSPFAGPDAGGVSYKPQYFNSFTQHRLSAFDGQNASGIWTLRVYDAFAGNSGTLYGPGQLVPWGGTASGTKLLITLAPVPEPQYFAAAFAGLLVLFAALRKRVAF